MTTYLDHAATTPLLPEVLEAYFGALSVVGNPSSIHSQGQQAKRMLEEAREQVAAAVGCDPIEVIFTSGGTEAVNLAIKGTYWSRNAGGVRPRILVPGGEHHATVDTLEWLAAEEGALVEVLPVDSTGRLDPAILEAAIAADPSTVALASFLWANNEVGTIQPVTELAAVAARFGVPTHSDAIAAFGYVPIAFRSSGLTMMSLSAHKIGGPVSVGALITGRAAELQPLLHGGGQQRRIRSGTQDVAGAVAFGVAASLAAANLEPYSASLTVLRDRLIRGVQAAVPEAILRGGTGSDRLPGNVHVTFPGCEGDSLLFLLDAAGFSVSTGSACQAGVPEVSHVLLAMGLTEDEARGALRLTLGHGTTVEDVDTVVAALPDAYARASRAGHSSRESAYVPR